MGLRKAILLILSLILITELSAADMKAEGIGATAKEAYINARENLSSYISYSSYSELNTQDESMSSIASSSSDIILLSLVGIILLVLALWFQFRDPTGGGQSGVNAPRLR